MKKWDISGTTRPIRLKFWDQVVETVPLVPYDVHLPQNPSHSTGKQVSNLNGSVQHSRRSPVTVFTHVHHFEFHHGTAQHMRTLTRLPSRRLILLLTIHFPFCAH